MNVLFKVQFFILLSLSRNTFFLFSAMDINLTVTKHVIEFTRTNACGFILSCPGTIS